MLSVLTLPIPTLSRQFTYDKLLDARFESKLPVALRESYKQQQKIVLTYHPRK